MTRSRWRGTAAWAAALLAPLVLAGCTAGSGGAPVATPRPTPAPAPPTAATTAATRTPSPTATGVRILARHLDVPWSIAVLPDATALISLREKASVVHVRADGSVVPVRATGPGGRVPGVQPLGEGGLLGLALSPAFASDHLLYAYLTASGDNRIVRMTYADDRLGEPSVVLSGIPKASNHNGGRIAFGPDGMLYAGTGDATKGGNAQDRSSLGGKILRVTPGGAPAPGNPFPGSPVWSYGHRNVQGFGWDPAGRMYASEFGQDTWDELNRIRPGANYGWPVVEGAAGRSGFTDPLRQWSTADASPSGVLVTRDAIYLAALRGKRLWRVPLHADGSTGTPQALYAGEFGRLRDVVAAPGGGLWVLTNNTARGTPGPDDDRLIALPAVTAPRDAPG